MWSVQRAVEIWRNCLQHKNCTQCCLHTPAHLGRAETVLLWRVERNAGVCQFSQGNVHKLIAGVQFPAQRCVRLVAGTRGVWGGEAALQSFPARCTLHAPTHPSFLSLPGKLSIGMSRLQCQHEQSSENHWLCWTAWHQANIGRDLWGSRLLRYQTVHAGRSLVTQKINNSF